MRVRTSANSQSPEPRTREDIMRMLVRTLANSQSPEPRAHEDNSKIQFEENEETIRLHKPQGRSASRALTAAVWLPMSN